MRYFLTVLALLAGFRAWGENAIPTRIDTSQLIQDDRFVPFPFSVQLPLPWNSVEGLWWARNGEFDSYYSFRLISGSERSYEVKQIDSLTCKTVAVGMGTLSRSSKTFMGKMRYMKFNQGYRMMVRAFDYREKVRQDVDITPINGSIIVLSVLSANKANFVHMPFTKVYDFYSPAPCRQRK